MHAREDAARSRREDELKNGPGRRASDTPAAGLLALQQTSGNAAVARLVQRQAGTQKKPPPKKTATLVDAQVIGMSVQGGKTVAKINKGTSAGIEQWMTGYIVGDDGKPYAGVTVIKADGGMSDAETSATTDEVNKHRKVVIDLSTTIRRGD